MSTATVEYISNVRELLGLHPRRGGGALSDTAIRLSVCPSLGYRHAGCGAAAQAIGTLAACSWPATRDVRTADPSADGRRSAASRTAIGGGRHYRLGRYLVVSDFVHACIVILAWFIVCVARRTRRSYFHRHLSVCLDSLTHKLTDRSS